ncbi:MAG: DNA mismatch repair protein MutS [Acidobacteriota bacterium]|nr:DNA mismatch repair protein MutS [Acidobacteriota bacterium]MDH3523990.1 DNA mismatch repair protein MutS [Acidobacteriota bacterium]
MSSPSGQLTPMLRHYLATRAEHPDAVLLYRMGDFYEVFFDDAVRVAPILEVTLTARNKGTDNEVAMCGVPYHALEVYLAKLVRAGVKAAICDQVEDPKEAKGLVRREVTRVVTPGTLSDPDLLEGKRANYLGSVIWNGDAGAGAFLEVSTGHFQVRRWPSSEQAVEDLRLLQPSEVLFEGEGLPAAVQRWIDAAPCRTPLDGDRWFDPQRASEELRGQLGVDSLRGFDLEDGEPAVLAAAAALAYARATQHSDLAHIRQLAVAAPRDGMLLDATTLANLEIFRTLRDGARGGTLRSVVDQTKTAAGGRLLVEWLRQPLADPLGIEARHAAVAELAAGERGRGRIRAALARVGDLERLLTRAVLGTMTPREAAVLRDTLLAAPELSGELREMQSSLLRSIAAADPLTALAAELERVLVKEPPARVKDGGAIREGVDAELDRHRSLARDSKRHVLAVQERERRRTGIGSLKVRYNKVFGYYIEVTRAHADVVPDDYVRKQTLVNAERYITPELKELEEAILGAEEQQLALERRHFSALVAGIAAAGAALRALAGALAALDVLANFAEVSVRRRYVRPEMAPPGEPIAIAEGRHPVVELQPGVDFIPNDADLSADESQIVLLTGPNMGGKSTYLRQVALIVVLAQAGCFVPARRARLGVVDRVFTRVGASDDLSRGESTFMVEMIETAKILHQATPESLVILDEVGRGTATFDGLSLAWAIVEFLHEERRPKTLFATHYHELTELASLLPRVVNRTMAVKEWDDRIVFLRRVVKGSADKSYGLHVAQLAGIPASVVKRAEEVLRNLEAQEYDFSGRPRLARGTTPESAAPDQLHLFSPPEDVIVDVLREIDLERLSPLAALNLLHSLKKRLEE